MEKMTEPGTEPTSVTRKEEVSHAGVEHSADAIGQFCRYCGAAMESGSTFCGDCGTHKIRPDRLKISLSRLIDEAMATRFCTQCGARVIEGKRFCHQCGQQIGEVNSEIPRANTTPAPALTPPALTKAQTQLNSDGLRGLPKWQPRATQLRHTPEKHHVDRLCGATPLR